MILTIHYFSYPKILQKKQVEERESYFAKFAEETKEIAELRFWDKEQKQTEKSTLSVPVWNVYLKRNLKF